MIKEEPKSAAKIPHCLTLNNRKELILSGVREVGSFDDRTVTAFTDLGELAIKGELLNIKKLNLELGELEITGKISSLVYSENAFKSNENIFSKLFK